jgi:flagellar biosynthesis protein FlhF
MKMRMFTAPTLDEAILLMRAELGPDAVLLSSREEDGHVEVRGAVERSFGHRFSAPSLPRFMLNETQPMLDEARDELSSHLRVQGAPDAFVHLVSEAGARLGAGVEPLAAMAAGLEGVLTFAPLQVRGPVSYFLVGPPGSGKTTAAAKIALHLHDRDSRLEPLSADFDASGQRARLAAMLLKPSVPAALTPDAMVREVHLAHDEGRRLIIDGPPFNPLDSQEMSSLKQLILRANVEPVLVLSAEGNTLDLEDSARAFAQVGVRRVILAKLDTVRRRGGVLAAISSARLSIASLGLTPNARCGLAPASSAEIARLLLPGVSGAVDQAKGVA